jgi:uncharacterized protein YdcH (DUF465 family)
VYHQLNIAEDGNYSGFSINKNERHFNLTKLRFADDSEKAMMQKYRPEFQELWKRLKLNEAELSRIKERQCDLKMRPSDLEPNQDLLYEKPKLKLLKKASLRSMRDAQVVSVCKTLSQDAKEKDPLAVSNLNSTSRISSQKVIFFYHELGASIIFDDARSLKLVTDRSDLETGQQGYGCKKEVETLSHKSSLPCDCQCHHSLS